MTIFSLYLAFHVIVFRIELNEYYGNMLSIANWNL